MDGSGSEKWDGNNGRPSGWRNEEVQTLSETQENLVWTYSTEIVTCRTQPGGRGGWGFIGIIITSVSFL